VAEAEEASTAASVLDASALIALLHDEPGAEAVVEAITAGAMVSVVNWAELLSKVAADGDEPREVAARFGAGDGANAAIGLEALSTEDCIAVAELRPLTKALGLSLGDRACLVLAQRLGVPALTADRSWVGAGVEVDVQLIR
jgi:PIN domain nuclease of toxin-antitoxin system